MSKKYMRVQKNFNKNGISRVPYSVSPKLGPVTPCNCSHPCYYGNGRTFCFPCYQKLVADSSPLKCAACDIINILITVSLVGGGFC